mgnify:CR=1 FL=1
MKYFQKDDSDEIATSKVKLTKRRVSIIFYSTLFCLIVLCVSIFLFEPLAKYQSAHTALDSGQYDTAIQIFTELSNYKDSAEMVLECKYQKADHLLSSGEYKEALAVFSEIIDYKDSLAQYKQSQYRLARQLLTANRFDEAIKTYQQLGSYENSEENLKEAKYKKAKSLATCDINQAIYIFNSINNYRDSHSWSVTLNAIKEYQGTWEEMNTSVPSQVIICGTTVATVYFPYSNKANVHRQQIVLYDDKLVNTSGSSSQYVLEHGVLKVITDYTTVQYTKISDSSKIPE